jgi:hypothetical protein
MKTTLTQEQVTTIIEEYFEDRGALVNMTYYSVAEDGTFEGVTIDHDFEVELPDGAASLQ